MHPRSQQHFTHVFIKGEVVCIKLAGKSDKKLRNINGRSIRFYVYLIVRIDVLNRDSGNEIEEISLQNRV